MTDNNTPYQKEVSKSIAKWSKEFDILQNEFNVLVSKLNLDTTEAKNSLWNKNFSSKHTEMLNAFQNEAINLWNKYNS